MELLKLLHICTFLSVSRNFSFSMNNIECLLINFSGNPCYFSDHFSLYYNLCQLAVVASHADLDIYWKSKLPNTPMPKAVRDILHSGSSSLGHFSVLVLVIFLLVDFFVCFP